MGQAYPQADKTDIEVKVLISSEAVVGLPCYEVTKLEQDSFCVRICAHYVGLIKCAFCSGSSLRLRDRRVRELRHENWGERRVELHLETKKWRCLGCGRSFWQRFPGILARHRATEPFRRSVFANHFDGISRACLSRREGIGSSTVERWFKDCLRRKSSEHSSDCPRMLGLDEHFFTRQDGYATTFCDLKAHRVFDVVLGRSELSLESYLNRLKGKEHVEMICMDLSTTYRSIARKHFPRARIVADRFHVIRLVNHHFLACWKLFDAAGATNRGLLSLMRRHRKHLKSPEQTERLDAYLTRIPALQAIYEFKQSLCELLSIKHRTANQCRPLARRFLAAISVLLDSKLYPLVTLGETLRSWQEEIAAMWRFTKNNGITEGFHNKMETLSRRAYGFRNFENYRLRVRVMCS